MTVYGSKVYNSFRYGTGSTTDISVYPFTTQCLDYGKIKLSWVFPLSTANFTNFYIVRSQTGFPVTPDIGDVVYKSDKTTLGVLLGTATTLTDTGLSINRVTGAATTTYTGVTTRLTNQTAADAVNSKTVVLTAINSNITVGQTVSYAPSGSLTGANAGSGVVGGTKIAAIDNVSYSPLSVLTLTDYATIPVGTTLTFSPTAFSPGKTYYYSAFVQSNNEWIRVGTAIGTSIKNYGTADIMYDSLPEIYKTALSTGAYAGVNKNVDLYNFLRTFGVQYDFIKTKVENANNRYDVNNLDGRLIPSLMDQMGFTYESNMGIQQGKRLLKNASYIYLNKGTGQGLKQFASSFTGYAATLGPIKNLFLTLDCSSFETGTGFWGASGLSLLISSTTSAIEGGTVTPLAITNSPYAYPNAQSGFLKAVATVGSATPYTSFEFSYGRSISPVNISSTTLNDSSAGYQYVTITTDDEHGFSIGQSVTFNNMQPAVLNGGSWKVINVADPKKFTVYCSALGFSNSIYPNGSVTVTTRVSYSAPNITLSTAKPHGLIPGQRVTISGAAPDAYNGVWTTQAGTTTSTIVLNLGSDPGAISTSGNLFSSPGTVALFDPVNCGIPVVASSGYQFSIYSWAKTTLRSVTIGIRWYNKNGDYLSSATTTSGNNAVGSWTRHSSPFPRVAPANSAYAIPYVSLATFNAAEVHYFDGAQFELPPGTSATTYADSRRVDIYLTAPRINRIINPSFETVTTGWSFRNGSLTSSTGDFYSGARSCRYVVGSNGTTGGINVLTGTTYLPAVTAGKTYTFSIYVKDVDTAKAYKCFIDWYDATGTGAVISSAQGTSTAVTSSGWTNISVTGTAPTGAFYGRPYIYSSTTFAVGDAGKIAYFDGALFEESQTVNPYFDGDAGYLNVDDLMYEQNAAGTKGTAITGRSLYYPNRMLVQSRLKAVLPDYMQIGTNFAVFIGTTVT